MAVRLLPWDRWGAARRRAYGSYRRAGDAQHHELAEDELASALCLVSVGRWPRGCGGEMVGRPAETHSQPTAGPPPQRYDEGVLRSTTCNRGLAHNFFRIRREASPSDDDDDPGDKGLK